MATVVLTGFMGTGKTKVGEKLAARLGRPFVDTDELVEREEGCSVESLFASKGEPYFRAAERRAIEWAVQVPGAVIATGGGAIVAEENFARLRASAPIVCLTARTDVIVERTRSAGSARPLLPGADPARHIEELKERRAAAYARADLTVDTSERSVEEVVDEIARFLGAGAPSGGEAA
jgi:shikimate kinase